MVAPTTVPPPPLLKTCLERLAHESNSTFRSSELKESVTAAIAKFDAEFEQNAESNGAAIGADGYWAPFKIACHHNQPPRIREAALDCLQKLIAHNVLRGALPLDAVVDQSHTRIPTDDGQGVPGTDNDLSRLDTSSPLPVVTDVPSDALPNDSASSGAAPSQAEPERPAPAPAANGTPAITARSTSLLATGVGDTPHYPPNPYLIDEIIHTVCTTFSGSQGDDTVQLQVLKVLLTAVTSTACEVHQVSLLKVIQTCFNIHLNSRAPVNQMTAKASLTQMVNLIFSRMERYADVLARSLETGSMAEIEKLTGLHDAGAEKTEASDVIVEGSVQPDVLNDNVMPLIEVDLNEGGSNSLDAPAEPSTESNTAEEQHGAASSDANENTPAADGSASTNGSSSAPPPTIVTTKPDGTSQQLEAPPQLARRESTGPQLEGNPYDPTIAFYSELLRKDVFLVFRLLCRLSVTSENSQTVSATFNAANVKEASSMNEISQQSTKARQLALELIMSVMNNCGPVFQSDDLYAGLIKQNLCLSISRNGVTTNPQLFELSLSIFLMVIRFFRSKLKLEIEALLNTIYLHILEMSNSTYNQKRMVLQALLKICENPQTLADFYLNYDCDISMVSLFERIVNVCSRVAQGRDTSTPVAATGIMGFAVSAAGLDSKEQLVKAQDRRLKLRGLCCLVALVNSLAEWSKDIAPSLPIISRIKKNIEVAKAMKTELKVEPAEKKSVDTPRSTTSDVPTKSFLDALAATNQANPVLVYKHPLHNVSMEHKHLAQAFSTGSATSLAATPTEWSPDDNVQIENLASRKLQMRNAIKQFNVKPTKGVKALIRDGFVEEDPMSIAKFLRTTDALTKAAIGEYLGEADAFNVDVMHAFIDTLDFTEMDFVPALRAFLQTFRLPGEAQKIDRIMEKFADRFYENNPDMFAKADTAYTLAFSVIMLNTDLHSPSIKHRMTPEGFIKNNRGINDDGDLPDELLTRIYEQVSKNEIIMEEEHAGRLAQMAVGWGAGDLDDRQRMELYRKEISQVQKKSLGMLKQGIKGKDMAPFRTASGGELARPMFGMASWPLMAVFSLAFEGANDDEEAGDESSGAAGLGEPKASDLALEGFSFSIRLASIFRMETERDAFVTSLSKLTGLSHIHDIRPKNIRAIKTLIVIADYLGEYLEGSWMQVLKAISHLERMQIILNRSSSFDGKRSGDYDRDGEGEEAGVIPFSGKPSSSNAYRTIEDVTSQARPNPAVEKLIAEFHNQATVVAVDRIFTNTLKLSATAIIHFFRCLCYVSMEEVGLDPVTTAPGAIPNQAAGAGTGSSAPRMYLLQKIVEIAYYNMPRIRFEWTQIWRILQPYFNTVACHPNFNVATFAVDSLRQLSMKFLEREELGHWTAQNEFLKSFEWIIKHNPDPRIKELILSSTRQMIQARGKSLRSGWKSIFVVLSKAAQSGDEKILRLSVSVVQMIFSGFFECVVGNAGAGFVDFVACLVEISLVEEPSGEEVAAGGIQLLQAVAKWLSGWNGDVNVPGRRKPSFAEAELKHANVPLTPGNAPAATQRHAAQPYFSANGLVTEDHFFLKWFPVLSAFSRIIIDSESVNVRTKAMDGLFDTLKSAGAIFEVGYWKNIQRSVILPIFAELGRGSDDDDDDDDETLGGERPTRVSIAKSTYKDPEMTAIYIHGLRLYIDLFTHYFTTLTANPDLLRSVFDLLVGMLTKRDEKLATTGGICLHGFIRDNMSSIDNDVIWGVVSEAIEKAFRGTLPGELLCCEYEAASAQSATPAPVKEKSEVAKIGLRAAREAVGEGKKVTLDTLDFEYVLIKCVTHLELVQGVRDLVFGSAVESSRRGSRRESLVGTKAIPIPGSLGTPGASSATSATSPSVNQTPTLSLIPAPYRARWVKCLYRSYAVARAFNEETALRQAIYRKGLVPQTPHLIKQETVSFATYLRVLFAVYKLDDTARTEVGQELVKETLDVLTRYTEFVADQGRHQLHLGLWSPVVVLVFKELLSMDELWVGPLQDGRGSAPSATHNGVNGTSGSTSAGGNLIDLQQQPTTTTASSVVDEWLPKSSSPPATPTSSPPPPLVQNVPAYFRVAVRIMTVERAEVRAVLQEFLERVGDVYIRV